MRTSRRMLKQVRRALYAALAFSGCINLLALATPLYALQVFETVVVPHGSLEPLAVLTAIAAAALVTLATLEGVRHNMLLRAGLWLDHHLSQHILHDALKSQRTPAGLSHDAIALGHLREFLTSGAIVVILDALWVPLFVGTLFLLHFVIGVLALGSVVLLYGLAILQINSTASLAREATESEKVALSWWTDFSSIATSRRSQIETAARQWEQINCRHVASLYALGKRAGGHEMASRAVRNAAQLALVGAGVWLITLNEMSPAAVVAASILLARGLSPFERLGEALVSAQPACHGYRRLKALPVDALTSGFDRLTSAGETQSSGALGDELAAHLIPPRSTSTGYGMAGVH